jgi:hypothetical protein
MYFAILNRAGKCVGNLEMFNIEHDVINILCCGHVVFRIISCFYVQKLPYLGFTEYSQFVQTLLVDPESADLSKVAHFFGIEIKEISGCSYIISLNDSEEFYSTIISAKLGGRELLTSSRLSFSLKSPKPKVEHCIGGRLLQNTELRFRKFIDSL